MNINKAIKKQKSACIRFVIAMMFIFLILPLLLVISKQINIFFISYLSVIEILILLSIAFKSNNEVLEFEIDIGKLKVKYGFPSKDFNLLCEKIDVVHAEGTGSNIKLVLLSKSKLRNKYLKEVDSYFLKEYPYAGHHYQKLKKKDPEKQYYYVVLQTGGYKKYVMLNELYKSCTGAFFTEDAIEQIKIYRNSK